MPTKRKSTEVAQKPRSRSPLRLYLLLITLAWVIGSLVSVGMLIYSVAKKIVITDQEYIISERYYEIDVCGQNTMKPTPINPNNYEAPTEAEKAKCKADKTAQLIQARQATFKLDVLSWAIRSILFVTLLLTHYPRFVRSRKEEN